MPSADLMTLTFSVMYSIICSYEAPGICSRCVLSSVVWQENGILIIVKPYLCHILEKIYSLWEEVILELLFVKEFSNLLNMPKISIRSIFRTFLI